MLQRAQRSHFESTRTSEEKDFWMIAGIYRSWLKASERKGRNKSRRGRLLLRNLVEKFRKFIIDSIARVCFVLFILPNVMVDMVV